MQIDQPTLNTKRLVLRPYRADDREDIFAYASNEEVARYVLWPAHQTVEDSQKFLDFIVASTRHEAGKIFFVFAIELNGKVIGSIDYKNVFTHSAQLDYAIGRDHWGKGYVTEAGVCLRDWGFFKFSQIIRLQSLCAVQNVGSRRVMEKIGMQKEGVRRKCMMVKGEATDIADYALLR
jgi:[ribosomal protein S5]-alanine N-acetyltransferase